MRIHAAAVPLLLAACAGQIQSVRDEDTVKPKAESAAQKPTPVVSGPAKPPPTRWQLVEESLHGKPVKDPYRWLEDEKSPEVQAWMKAQDDFTRAELHKEPARDWLTRRYTELYYLEQVGAPIKRGGRYFYSRTHKDKEKGIVYWKASEKAPEKVLLDPNAWSTDNTVSLGVWVPSWDGKKVVFAERPNAADEATLYVLDVDSGERSKVDVIPGAKYAGPSWLPDSKGFYYEWLPVDSKIPVSERPGYTELRLHKLGEDPAKDAVLHEKTGDPKTFLGGGVSRDGHWLFAFIQRGWNENDVYFQRVGKDKEWKLLVKGVDATYGIDVWKDVFYVTTDEGAPNKRVFTVDPTKPDRKNWKELIPQSKEAAIESVVLVGGHIAIGSLKKAVSVIDVYTLAGKKVREIELPGLGTATNLVGLEDDDEAYYAFSSFTLPRQVFKTSVKSGKSDLWAKVDVPVDPSPYEVKQIFYPARDGDELISMFIVARKDVKLDGENPVLLYGYGGFDVSLTSAFTSFIYPWLEIGGVYAVPNLRGGGEYGKSWHDAGKLKNKQNVFDDFIGAAEQLVKLGYTNPRKLAIRGGSNGGLLVGAVMAQRPDLFGAVLCAVPLLDMVRYPLFGSGKTWVPEYGDPEQEADFGWLYAYSPYHQLQDGVGYPPMLMLSADHDDRVDPMHARKFTARVQAASKSGAPAWLRIEMHAGHGGSDQVAKAIESSVDQISFLFGQFGLKAPVAKAAAQVAPAEGSTQAKVP